MRRTTAIITSATAVGAAGLALTVAAVLPAAADDGDATDQQSFLADRVDRFREALSGFVEDGTLTDAEADTVAETLGESDALRGPGGHGHGPRAIDLDVAAETLGLTADELRTQMQDGSTLAEIAQVQGTDVSTLVDALVQAATDHVDQDLAEGDIDQDRADALKANLGERISDAVEQAMPMGGDRDGRGPDRGMMRETTPEDATESGTTTPSPES